MLRWLVKESGSSLDPTVDGCKAGGDEIDEGTHFCGRVTIGQENGIDAAEFDRRLIEIQRDQ